LPEELPDHSTIQLLSPDCQHVPATFVVTISRTPTGKPVEVVFFRKDSLRRCRLTPVDSPERRFTFAVEDGPPAAARAIRRGWLGL
jgi:hypothetical protein